MFLSFLGLKMRLYGMYIALKNVILITYTLFEHHRIHWDMENYVNQISKLGRIKSGEITQVTVIHKMRL